MGHEEKTIRITQSLKQISAASYIVKMTVHKSDDVEAIEFNYERTNQIYPIYRSLIDLMSDYEDVQIELETDSEAFVNEFTSVPNRNAKLLQMLNETLDRRNITIDATLI